MAIFSTRSSKRDGDQAPTKNVPIDSIETLRTRARQRLIGAAVLVALGIITFTLLFDSQPRPIPVDIQITMPDKDKPGATVSTTVHSPVVAPIVAPVQPSVVDVTATPTTSAPAVVAAAAVPSAAVQASASLSAKEEIVASKSDKKAETKSEVKPEIKVEPKVEVKPVDKAEVKPVVKSEAKSEVKPVTKPATDEAAKALAILEGKEPPKTSVTTTSADSTERFIVQFGAYAENEKAREARLKVEHAGLKTYVHVAETPQGRRIRVRAGPFATRVEAEKAAAKIKALSLPAAILTL